MNYKDLKEHEEEIWAEVLSGGSFQRFYDLYLELIKDRIKHTLVKAGKPYTTEDHEEIVALVWLNLVKDGCKKLRKLNPYKRSSASWWIGIIANNTTYDYIRNRTKAGKLPFQTEMDSSDGVVDVFVSPEDQHDRNAQSHALNCVLNRLSADEQTFLSLYIYGYTTQSLSEYFQISKGAVYAYRARIVKTIQLELRKRRTDGECFKCCHYPCENRE